MRCAANAAWGDVPARRVGPGTRLQVRDVARDGELLPLKADPYARQSELRPATASVVAPAGRRGAARWMGRRPQRANALDAPVSIYEVHLASWRRRPRQGAAGSTGTNLPTC